MCVCAHAQLLQSCLTAMPWTVACQASLSFTLSRSLLKLMSIESVMPSSHLILCHPLLFLPSVFPRIRVLSNKLSLHIRLPKFWIFGISPSNEYSGLISFRIDWFDLLVEGLLSTTRVFSSTTIRKHWFFHAQANVRTCITESFCYTAEINTAL